MKNIKYTEDGKKVEFFTTINTKQSIVKEIFIDADGNESSQGEKFVVNSSSLRDKPVITWKERRLIEIDKEYNNQLKLYEDKTKKLQEEYNQLLTKLREKNNYIRKYIANKETLKSFEFVNNVLTGKFKYIVPLSLYKLEIIPYDVFLSEYSYNNLKLLTIYGKDDGSLSYRINQYSDGSGFGTEYAFCKTKKEAINIIKNLLKNAKTITYNIVEVSKKYNVKLNEELLTKWKNDQRKNIENNIKIKEKFLNDYQKKLDNLNKI